MMEDLFSHVICHWFRVEKSSRSTFLTTRLGTRLLYPRSREGSRSPCVLISFSATKNICIYTNVCKYILRLGPEFSEYTVADPLPLGSLPPSNHHSVACTRRIPSRLLRFKTSNWNGFRFIRPTVLGGTLPSSRGQRLRSPKSPLR